MTINFKQTISNNSTTTDNDVFYSDG